MEGTVAQSCTRNRAALTRPEFARKRRNVMRALAILTVLSVLVPLVEDEHYRAHFFEDTPGLGWGRT